VPVLFSWIHGKEMLLYLQIVPLEFRLNYILELGFIHDIHCSGFNSENPLLYSDLDLYQSYAEL